VFFFQISLKAAGISQMKAPSNYLWRYCVEIVIQSECRNQLNLHVAVDSIFERVQFLSVFYIDQGRFSIKVNRNYTEIDATPNSIIVSQ